MRSDRVYVPSWEGMPAGTYLGSGKGCTAELASDDGRPEVLALDDVMVFVFELGLHDRIWHFILVIVLFGDLSAEFR